MSALEKIDISDKKPVERITVSTTLVTNAILQGKLPKVKLCLFHGYGMKLEALHWPVPYHLLSGVIDYRGREIKAPEQTEWDQLSRDLANDQENITRAAIVGKFSHRNKTHEEQLAAYLREHNPGLQIALGHLWGQANFYRRSLTTYLNLASHDLYRQFAANLQQAVEAEGCSAPISVLKADGGALPLASIRPIDSIFSGPSASVLGALAQNEESESFVVVDIGGTTTDLGIVLSGIPLMSSKGAKIEAFSTLVHSLAVRSVPVGGDSQILKTNQGFALADYRSGPAYCLGGGTPTPTDAMRYLKLVNYGDWVKAGEALLPCFRLKTGNRRTSISSPKRSWKPPLKKLPWKLKNSARNGSPNRPIKSGKSFTRKKPLSLRFLSAAAGRRGSLPFWKSACKAR